MLLPEHRRAGQVDEQVGVGEQLVEPVRQRPVDAAVLGGVAIRPRLVQPAVAERALHVRQRVRTVGGDGVGHGVVRPRARVFDVHHLPSETAEALEVVEHLPGHTRERRHPHHAEDDDAGLVLPLAHRATTAPDSDCRWA